MKAMNLVTSLLVVAISSVQAGDPFIDTITGRGWGTTEFAVAAIMAVCAVWFIHNMIARTDAMEKQLADARGQLNKVNGEVKELQGKMTTVRTELTRVSDTQEDDRRIAGEKRQKLFKQITALEAEYQKKCEEQ